MYKPIYFIVALSMGVFSCITGHAQNFEVAPVEVRFDAEPGESQKQLLHVRNHSQEKQKYQLTLRDFKVNQEGKKIPTAPGSTDHSIVDWITLNPAVFELKPNQEGKVEVSINVPPEGYSTRWGVLHVKPVQEQTAAEADKSEEVKTGINIVPRISVWIEQSPASSTDNKARVTDLSEVNESPDSLRTFRFRVVNTGEKILNGKAWLSLVKVKTGKEEVFPKKKVEVFPGQSREYTLTIPNEAVKKGKYALAAILDYGDQKPLEAAQVVIE